MGRREKEVGIVHCKIDYNYNLIDESRMLVMNSYLVCVMCLIQFPSLSNTSTIFAFEVFRIPWLWCTNLEGWVKPNSTNESTSCISLTNMEPTLRPRSHVYHHKPRSTRSFKRDKHRVHWKEREWSKWRKWNEATGFALHRSVEYWIHRVTRVKKGWTYMLGYWEEEKEEVSFQLSRVWNWFVITHKTQDNEETTKFVHLHSKSSIFIKYCQGPL